jgi:hypothetical protein
MATYISHMTLVALLLLQQISPLKGSSIGSTAKASLCKVIADFTAQPVNLPQFSWNSTLQVFDNCNVNIHISSEPNEPHKEYCW